MYYMGTDKRGVYPSHACRLQSVLGSAWKTAQSNDPWAGPHAGRLDLHDAGWTCTRPCPRSRYGYPMSPHHQQNPSDLLDLVPRMSLRCTQASLGWSSEVSASPHYVHPAPGSSDLSDSEVRPGEKKKRRKKKGKGRSRRRAEL